MKLLPLLFLPLAFASGCATVTTADNFHGVRPEGRGTPIETVMIENTGWQFLKFIPLGGGNPEKPNRCSCVFFEDTTTLDNNMAMLEREMKRVGATKVANLTSKTINETVFIILFSRTACRTSAVLLK